MGRPCFQCPSMRQLEMFVPVLLVIFYGARLLAYAQRSSFLSIGLGLVKKDIPTRKFSPMPVTLLKFLLLLFFLQ